MNNPDNFFLRKSHVEKLGMNTHGTHGDLTQTLYTVVHVQNAENILIIINLAHMLDIFALAHIDVCFHPHLSLIVVFLSST